MICPIYKKMKQQKLNFDDLYDLVGVRVLTGSLKDCYAVLGLIHSLWKPIPGRFKDYIAMPKPNLYQSLHTAVIGPDGERIEVQIRTGEMHRICEEGIAAHWQYKESESSRKKPMDQQLTWVRHLLETQRELKNPKEFLNSFKVDLFSNEVYVFTPEGDVIALQYGATPVDFAYAVHTDIGTHCSAARINGKIVPLRYKLKNGDQVEISTSKSQQPSRDWLAFVKTAKARGKILHFINTREKARSLSLGKELLEKELIEYDVQPSLVLKGKTLDEAVYASGFGNYESLLISIGLGKISTHHFIEKLLPKEKIEEVRQKEAGRIKLKEKSPGPAGAIKLKCFNEDILLRVGKCCHPVPGDPIVGYITRGRGVTVHHLDCPSLHALENESERLVDVEWGQGVETAYPVRISIVAEDKPGQLAEITQVMADCDINITQANLRQGSNRRAYFDFFIEICDLDHLNRTLQEVRKIPGVIHLERVKEYSTKKKGVGKFQSDGSGGSPSDQTPEREILAK
ncbi:MAG: bifunctional (p)ppGpp synthetase/guanosine-3',5'-bis(diphosphate) 3'-pyrophosphohydrolase [Nitrospinae bacterium]|nr:bifunctional (p)ppGpp synthetase/guanosine-3',5'-bis(diphosphate) 3'-pyrophosphohydrolase [Nitrospinota bacterium]